MNASAQRETTISQPQGKKNITYIIHIYINIYVQHKEGKRKREFVFYLNIPEYSEKREESRYYCIGNTIIFNILG